MYYDSLSIAGTQVTIEDRTATVTQTHVDLIQTVLSELYSENSSTIGGFVSHGNITIVVENASSYQSGDDRRIINSTSFAVRSAWLIGADASAIKLNIYYGLEGMDYQASISKKFDNGYARVPGPFFTACSVRERSCSSWLNG
jgi:hypothetical protein